MTSRLVLEEIISDLEAAIELEDHQHVVYMAGTDRWEIVGTGLVFDGPKRKSR